MLDQTIVNLAKAIRTTESNGNYQATGASGEKGAYQFMPGTWSGWAKQHLGDANAPMTESNQNQVAYKQIESWKNQGYQPQQIASLWNSGDPNWAGKVGVNKMGVKYDVPAYVNTVTSNFAKIKSQNKIAQTPIVKAPGSELPFPEMALTDQIQQDPETLTGKIADTFFGNTGKFIGGALLNITNLIASKSKPVQEMTESDRALTEIDTKAVTKAHELALKGDTEGADRLLKMVQSHGTNITLNDILPESQQETVGQIAGAGLGSALETGMLAQGTGLAGKAVSGAYKGTEAVSLGQKALGVAKTGGKLALEGAGYGTGFGLSSAMQEKKDLGDTLDEMGKSALVGAVAVPLLAGGVSVLGGGVGKLASVIVRRKAVAENLSKRIIEETVNMTDTMARNETKAGKDTIGTIMKYGWKGDKEAMYNQAAETASQGGKMMSELIKNSPNANQTRSLTELEDKAITSLKNYTDDYGAKINTTEYKNYVNTIKESFQNARDFYGFDKVQIPVLDEIKKDLWEKSYSQANFQIVNEAKQIAGNVVKDAIEQAIPDVQVKQLNGVLGEILHARNILYKTMTRPVGTKFGSRLIPIATTILGLPDKFTGALTGYASGKIMQGAINATIDNPEARTAFAQILARYAKVHTMDDPFIKAMQAQLKQKFSLEIESQIKLLPEGITKPAIQLPERMGDAGRSGIIENAPKPTELPLEIRPGQKALMQPAELGTERNPIITPAPTTYEKGVLPRENIGNKKGTIRNFIEGKVGLSTQDVTEGLDVTTAGVIRGTKGMTADQIMAKYPDIQLKREIKVTDIYGKKSTIDAGEALTPYELKGNKVLLQDGETYIVSKNQYQNIKGNAMSSEAKEFAPELKGTEETVKGGSKWQGDNLISNKDTVANVVKNDDGTWSYISDFSEGTDKFKTRDEAMQQAEMDTVSDPYFNESTKYTQYQLPGGKNYKEILIKAPVEVRVPEKIRQIEGGGTVREPVIKNFQNTFKSSHWDEPNVISHLRLNERTYQGKPVTFMEELQSDWAREARAKGTFTDVKELPTGYEIKGDINGNPVVVDETGRNIASGNTFAEAKQNALKYLNTSGKTPNNPLLKNWQELSIKRALKEAVDNNSEYLAWTTGEQQAARYNLSKNLKSVDWGGSNLSNRKIVDLEPVGDASKMRLEINPDGKIYKTEGNGIKEWEGKKLDEVIGKGLAEKIMAKEEGNLSGEGLSFGGEWAKNLYDKQVKNIVEDLTGGKVEVLDMGLGNGAREPIFTKLGRDEGSLVMPTDLKVGLDIADKKGTGFIVTKILGDGKFKAIQKSALSEGNLGNGLSQWIKDLNRESYAKRLAIKNKVEVTDPGINKLIDDRYKFIKNNEKEFDISTKKTQNQAIKITPELRAKVKGEAVKFK